MPREPLEAIMLVGGKGTRLRPLTLSAPKPLLPTAGVPFLAHQLARAAECGITHVVLATSYRAEMFTEAFGTGEEFGLSIDYVYETEPLGTGGGIRNAARLLRGGPDEPVVVLNGDVLSGHDLPAQVDLHRKKDAAVTLHLVPVDDPSRYGCVPTAATHNLSTLQRAAAQLRAAGRDPQVNAPGTNSSVLLASLADAGATQVEPGHALTGTTPLHAVRADLPERPAAAYLTEVSHIHGGRAYCFGGGLYIDPVFADYPLKALVAPGGDFDRAFLADAEIPPPSAIDYYGMLTPPDGEQIRPGDCVLFGFRIQAFVTRAFVVPISGVASAEPRARGIWGADGRPARWPPTRQLTTNQSHHATPDT